MSKYKMMVIVLRFFVDILLLMGTNRLCGYSHKPVRYAMGALVGAIYSSVCLIPGFHFLGNMFWRVIFLGISSWAAFGTERSALYRGAMFCLLHLAVFSILGFSEKPLYTLVFAAVGVWLLSVLGTRYSNAQRYVPVELCYRGKRIKLTALLDTGNTLYDPVSGQSVLVVGADAAQALTGLTREQLRQPVESIGSLPGLRLIPYKTIDTDCCFMLGLRIGQVQIGSYSGSRVVAFAPQQLGSHYQALAGGVL